MSDAAQRIPLALAADMAGAIMAGLRLKEPEAMVVGSIRRGCADVGDIEIIAPLPEPDAQDWLFKAIGELFLNGDDFGSMYPRKGTIGSVLRGHRPGFGYCQLRALLPDLPAVNVDIFRYTPGAKGNRGWVELQRTGSAEFAKSVLSEWKRLCGTLGSGVEGSRDGFLVDSMGNPRATPTEASVFKLIGREVVPPGLRGGRIQ